LLTSIVFNYEFIINIDKKLKGISIG